MFWGRARVELMVPPGTGDCMIPVSLRHLGLDAMALNVYLRVSEHRAARG